LNSGVVLTLLLAALALLLAPVSGFFAPGPLGQVGDAAAGLLLALGAVGLQRILRRQANCALAGGFLGGVMGALAARLLAGLAPGLAWGSPGASLFTLLALGFIYVGATVGAGKGGGLSLSSLRDAWRGTEPRIAPKIIDTSVIIDGRIHDVIKAGFLDGRIMVPQFVLSELQQVADSSDSLKRARGRKGLEMLQAMKGLPSIQVEITQEALPEIREVDLKLIELARRTGGKLVTNDFNLNKVARVRDVPVLNINDLANALKPVVLPGEPMRVFVLKAGKEAGQGVAYLDDGTMVVVDDGRDHVGKNVDILVTSVLQTTAGKMFFGRMVPREALNDELGAR
jgi:uncharacterized protein YacL